MHPVPVKLALLVASCTALVAGAAFLLTSGGSPAALAPPQIAPARATPSPPSAALTLAKQDGRRVLALSVQHRGSSVRATVTVLDASGQAAEGLRVRLDETAHSAICGPGCYRAVIPRGASRNRIRVEVRGPGSLTTTTVFILPRRWPVSALGALRRAQRALRKAHSVVYREHLESAPGQAITTTWRVIAPDRLAYSIAGGSSAVVIGAQRWDRPQGSTRWLRSPQERLDLPALPWSSQISDVYLLDPPRTLRGQVVRLALFDPSTPAWYDVTLDAQTFHIRSLLMVAPSHFMRDQYAPYDLSTLINPPASP